MINYVTVSLFLCPISFSCLQPYWKGLFATMVTWKSIVITHRKISQCVRHCINHSSIQRIAGLPEIVFLNWILNLTYSRHSHCHVILNILSRFGGFGGFELISYTVVTVSFSLFYPGFWIVIWMNGIDWRWHSRKKWYPWILWTLCTVSKTHWMIPWCVSILPQFWSFKHSTFSDKLT